MKNAFLLLFALLPSLLLAQTEGTYFYSYGLGVEYFRFMKENKFEYYADFCGQAHQGKGNYKREGHKLSFYYESDTAELKENCVFKSVIKTDSTDILFDIDIYDGKTYVPLKNCICLVEELKNGYVVNGNLSDSLGNTKIWQPYSNDSLALKTEIYRYKPFRTKIIPNKNYRIQIYLYKGVQAYETGEIWHYKIKKVRKNHFLLKKDHESAKFLRFKKIEDHELE